MRRVDVVSIIVLIAFCASASAYAWSTNPGNGSAANPYQISTPEQLNSIGTNSALLSGYFVLTADIDMSAYTGTQYAIIGNLSKPFRGVFDGAGFSIYNVSYDTVGMEQYVGFFGHLSNATIRDLHLRNIKVSATQSKYVGGLAGYQHSGEIVGCSVEGCITGLLETSYAGGLVGYLYAGSITDSFSSGTVSCPAGIAGGLLGKMEKGSISDSLSLGTVICSRIAGGFAGVAGGSITKSQSGSTVTPSASYKSYVAYVGGFAGYIGDANVIECSSTGNVSGMVDIDLSGHYIYAGGFVGFFNSGALADCYSSGNVSTSSRYSPNYSFVGGLAGFKYNPAAVERCYSKGAVTSTSSLIRIGGLIGQDWAPGTVKSSFWDIQTSGLTASASGIGKTTAQMKTQITFGGWDFVNTWVMNGYPALRWEISPLQARIDAAQHGDTVVVEPGVYAGRLYFRGKNITLTSIDPTNPNIVASTILQGREVGPVVTLQGTETSDCIIQGFTIQGGHAPLPGGGGICGTGATSMATIRNCIIQNNFTSDYGGGIGGVKGLISNCIIRNNSAKHGGGLSWCDGIIENCLIVSNTASTTANAIHRCNGQVVNCTIVSVMNIGVSQADSCAGSFISCILSGQPNDFNACTGNVTYCCYPSAAGGTGNFAAAPMFGGPTTGNYRLLQASPCINAGEPEFAAQGATDLDGLPRVTGNRIDMGAYEFGVPVRLEVVQKERVGRSTFAYTLAAIVENVHAYEMLDMTPMKRWYR